MPLNRRAAGAQRESSFERALRALQISCSGKRNTEQIVSQGIVGRQLYGCLSFHLALFKQAPLQEGCSQSGSRLSIGWIERNGPAQHGNRLTFAA